MMTTTATPNHLRTFILAILLLGMAGTSAELLLLAHYDDLKQLIPLSLMAVAVVVLAWYGWTKGRASVRALRWIMALFVVAGAVGVILHLRGSMEFQTEIDPSLQGMKLLLKALRVKAPPALAPGVMAQLGFLGLAFTFRHPALLASPQATTHKGR